MRTLLIMWVGIVGIVATAALCGFASDLPELVLQSGHSKLVDAVAISPDNKWVATGSFDSTIRIWSVETGRELRTLTGHQGAITGLVWLPNDAVASVGNDGTARFWTVATGSELAMFKEKRSLNCIAAGLDDKAIAYTDIEGNVVVRDATSREMIGAFSVSSSEITALALNGRQVAVGSADATITIWDVAARKVTRTLKGNTGKISSLRFNASGDLLASGNDDGKITLWEPTNGRRVSLLAGHVSAIAAFVFNGPDHLLSFDRARNMRKWLRSAKGYSFETAVKDPAVDDAETAVFSRDGAIVVSGNGDGTAALVDTKDGREMQRLETHTVGFYDVKFSPDGHWLAAAAFDNTVKIWDLRTGDSLPPLTGHTGRVTGVAFTPGDRLITSSVDHTMRVWDLLARKPIAVMQGHSSSIGGLAAHGELAVSAGADGLVGVWDLSGKVASRMLRGHTGEVVSVDLSEDGKLIASAGVDGTARLWDAATGGQLGVIDPKAGELDAVAFDADRKTFATAGIDGIIRIWQVNDASKLREIVTGGGKVNSLAFATDGRSIVSGGQDKTVRVWRFADGRELTRIEAHAGPVFSAAYSPDGRFIASASDDGSVVLSNAVSGHRSATLLSLKGGDWLAVTPRGFFDGSPAAWRQLSWRFDRSTFNARPVELFFSEYYLPGLLSDIIKGSELPQVSAISERDRRQPELKIATLGEVSGSRNVKVAIDVTSAPAGARDLRLFRNGSLIRSWKGDLLGGKTRAGFEATIPIVAGENRLTAYAFNNDNVKSSDAFLDIKTPDAIGRKGKLYILSIGVNEYSNPEFNLRFAVADADDFSEEVRRQQSGVSSYQSVELVPLRNSGARKASILATLRDLAGQIQPEDGVIVYFAGHGIADKSHFYLVPFDIGYAGRRSAIDENGLLQILASSISDEELDDAVRDIDAAQLLLVIDACNSGQVLETDEKRRGPMNSKGLAQLAYEKGMYILTAAQSYQAAQEAAKLGHGFLTFALVEEGLKTNAADDAPRDGEVTLREWLDYATARVPQIQQEDLTARELTRDKSDGRPRLNERSIQRPRVFYRREPEARPFIVARH